MLDKSKFSEEQIQDNKKELLPVQDKLDSTRQKLDTTVERLVGAIQLAYNNPKRIFWLGVLKGLAQGLGATIGVAIIIFILSWILKQLGGIPFLADWVNAVNQKLPLQK